MGTFLVPDFVRNFKCIGDKCENTCCKSWIIFIDKQTYYTYKKSKNSNLKRMIDNSVCINDKSANDADYAKIILNEDKLCPFLNVNGLCSIHGELGHKALSYTCKVYPRVYNKVGKFYEKSLQISCPEVSRIALLNKDKMSFTEIDIPIDFDVYCNKVIDQNEDVFWVTRIFVIEILQNRNFKLWERMAILGVFLEKGSHFINDRNYVKLNSMIDAFRLIISGTEVHNLLKGYKKNEELQLELTRCINDFRKQFNIVDETFLELQEKFLKGLTKEENFGNECLDIEKNDDNKHYMNFIDEYEYILENYLVHYVFTNLFPYAKNSDSFDEYVILTLNFILIKNYLAGLRYEYNEINDELIVKFIHSYSRVYSHGNKTLDVIYNNFKSKGLMTLENIILLIRD